MGCNTIMGMPPLCEYIIDLEFWLTLLQDIEFSLKSKIKLVSDRLLPILLPIMITQRKLVMTIPAKMCKTT